MKNPYRAPKAMTKRVAVYTGILVALLVGGIIGTSWVLGYRLDGTDGSLERIGLLQFGTTPDGATISVDGTELNFLTPGRQEHSEGTIKLQYSLDGYEAWNKTVNLSSAQVLWLNYARLSPNKITQKTVKKFAAKSVALPAPNHSSLIVLNNPAANKFTFVDLSAPEKPTYTTLVIPEAKLEYAQIGNLGTGDANYYANNTQSEITPKKYRMVEFNQSSKFVLIEVTYTNKDIRFVSLNIANPARSLNLSQTLAANVANPHYSGESGNIFFCLVDDDLHRANLSNKKLSKPLVSDVQAYSIYGTDKLLYKQKYVSKKAEVDVQNIGVWDDWARKNWLLHTYDGDDMVLAAWTHYYDEDFVAIYRQGKLSLEINPIKSTATTAAERPPVVIDVTEMPDWIEFNGTGRFLLIGCGKNIMSYDLELRSLASFTPDGYSIAPPAKLQQVSKISTSKVTTVNQNSLFLNPVAKSQPLTWLDDFYMQYETNSGQIAWVEFDGQNARSIMAGQMPAMISANNAWMFAMKTTGTTSKRQVLASGTLITETTSQTGQTDQSGQTNQPDQPSPANDD